VALLEKRRYLNNRSGDFPQVILIVPSHVPNTDFYDFSLTPCCGVPPVAFRPVWPKIKRRRKLHDADHCQKNAYGSKH
jgi:hypothetical protein